MQNLPPAPRPLPVLSAAVLALAASCASAPSAPAGRAPAALVQLYDQLAPDGMMEVEFDRDGNFLEMEADVPVESVPDVLIRSTRATYPDADITGAEREVQGDEWTWEIKFRSGGRSMEVVLDDAGNVLETERELTADEAPAAVISASEGAVPRSGFLSVERITGPNSEVFHVKRQRGTARYKVVLDADGRVLRKVREAVAEIEIPVR
ncbi:MAG: PepSY-like domain-containing protein [Planctomycetota bacterium]